MAERETDKIAELEMDFNYRVASYFRAKEVGAFESAKDALAIAAQYAAVLGELRRGKRK